MGVRGLTSYVTGNPRLKQEHQFGGALRVVLGVDGNAFVYFCVSRTRSEASPLFGSDYRRLYETVCRIVDNFRRFNVELEVFFDGDEQIEEGAVQSSKAETWQKRTIERYCRMFEAVEFLLRARMPESDEVLTKLSVTQYATHQVQYALLNKVFTA